MIHEYTNEFGEVIVVRHGLKTLEKLLDNFVKCTYIVRFIRKQLSAGVIVTTIVDCAVKKTVELG